MGNKIGLVISREYYVRVKKRSFLLTTILVPLVIIGFYALIIMISLKGESERSRLAVIDEAGLFSDSTKTSTDIVFIKNETESSFVKKYKKQGYDAFLYIPKLNIDSPANIVMHSPSSASMRLLSSAENKLDTAIENKRLQSSGISAAAYRKIAADVHIQSKVDSDTGSKQSIAGIATGVGFMCGMLIYIMMIIYGTQVMRGVIEEKTSRIAEVIVSSVKPTQLMIGKIVGIGLVGLTQFTIWILIMLTAAQFISPQVTSQMGSAAGTGSGAVLSMVTQGVSALPLLKIALCFIFYFLAGYLVYASLFAAVGSMASDDQQDTQQLIFPVLMPIILGFVIMTKAIAEPNSSLAVFGSLFPLTSPIVMMGRISFDVPAWQLAVSMLLLTGCFLFLAWLSGKIYRTGILMYGKKPSWKEMIKWAVKRS